MRKLSGGQASVESLEAEKVRHVFGLIGSATMEIYDALYDAAEIDFIGVHDERTSTHIADEFGTQDTWLDWGGVCLGRAPIGPASSNRDEPKRNLQDFLKHL